MKLGMTRWNLLPAYVSALPDLPTPFSPVHSARKFSTVLGTVLPYRPNTMRPAAWPSISMSKYTLLVTLGSCAGASAGEAGQQGTRWGGVDTASLRAAKRAR